MNAQQKWLEQAKSRKDDLARIVSRFNADRVPAFRDALDADNLRVAGEILQETWEKAPDQPWIHTISGWGLLCDLCSDFVFGDAGFVFGDAGETEPDKEHKCRKCGEEYALRPECKPTEFCDLCAQTILASVAPLVPKPPAAITYERGVEILDKLQAELWGNR